MRRIEISDGTMNRLRIHRYVIESLNSVINRALDALEAADARTKRNQELLKR